MRTGSPEEIRLLTQRLDFLEHLSATPSEKPRLVEALGHSRSTVDRAIRQLSEAGFVTRTEEGYTTTVTGRLAVERYTQFRAEQDDILTAGSVLEQLPANCSLPVDAVTGASPETGDGRYWLFEHVAPLVRAADRYQAVLPRVEDSRHLRLCQARAEQAGLSVSLLAAPETLLGLREEFPHLSTSLAETVDIGSVETPPYGLVLVEHSGETTVLVVTYDDSGPAGLLVNDTDDAVRWAREQFEAVREAARDASEELRNVETGHSIHPLSTGERLPPRLRSQGFDRIDEAYFEDRQTMDPTTGWRAGLGVSEVAAGYAVERDGEEGPLTESLLQQLREGECIALLGPAESGKSTVCKQVAYRWFEGDYGPVLYREGDGGQPFDAVGELETVLQTAEGHALVVVEDAVRSDANTVFEVMQSLSGRSDVSFLLDARESEWDDPETHPIDARLAAFRQAAIETVQMPSPSDDDSGPIASQ